MLGKFEPVLNSFTISTLVTAVIAVCVAFNVPITDEQRNALLALVAAICVVFGLGATVARNNVYPVEKVEDEIVPEAFRAGVNSSRLGDEQRVRGSGMVNPLLTQEQRQGGFSG